MIKLIKKFKIQVILIIILLMFFVLQFLVMDKQNPSYVYDNWNMILEEIEESPVDVISVEKNSAPLIDFTTDGVVDENINGPSVIKVPEWIENPLGKYYMYFADHRGKFIYLAYADDPLGPWEIHEDEIVAVNDSLLTVGHVASPDVHVDYDKQEIVMYYHAPALFNMFNQLTFETSSDDGLRFDNHEQVVASNYFRRFEYEGKHYGIDKNSYLYQYKNNEWIRSENQLIKPFLSKKENEEVIEVKQRHVATYVKNDILYLFYSRIGDQPERILLSTVNLNQEFEMWEITKPIEIVRPSLNYEGVNYPENASTGGPGINKNELRDPYIFVDDDEWYLYHSYGGEMGITVARIEVRAVYE